jgi:hypothetical protein
MRFTLAIDLGNDAIQTGADLAELLVRIAPTVERCVGDDLANCVGAVRDPNGREVGNWTFVKPKMPEARPPSGPVPTTINRHPTEPAATSTDPKHLTVRDINSHLSDGSRACYVNIGCERIPIRHARIINGQVQGKSLFRPGEWIAIPPDAKVELLD